ncbi:glycosyltransferase family 4 protein (plasmid) [Ensifer adhaerens]|uniref:glycosyltransferase family 4 protein n=1 Tax=Ensifer adhaerens TaxID=106592 RepID=UPI003AF3F511|nr:glycosyltransferase family 4 protein [Ensifer adhaerens]UAY05777.1 glycosyltransferase family 4 protein [Ensifer adhaerens]UAY13155.1 glycosyltransferase family 4 protein [Ensifer adhaerens]
MTVDAVGGVWRYAMDLASAAQSMGIEVIFAGFGPPPSVEQADEARRIGTLEWVPAPLDWTATAEQELTLVPWLLEKLVTQHSVDLLHVNLPSQAVGIHEDIPVVAVSHSCVATWFQSVRGTPPSPDWFWHKRLNSEGFKRANVVLSPSASHAASLVRCYGAIERIVVVHNATRCSCRNPQKQHFVFAAARWWDDGKNGAVLDAAAGRIVWPLIMAGACTGPDGQGITFDHANSPGELSHPEVTKLMSRASIVVSPSIYEPFGLVALEAARVGAALVLADIPSYRELWDGVAVFANPHDPAAFADAVNAFIVDPSRTIDFARRAQIRSTDFTIEAQRDGVLNAYRQAMRPFVQPQLVGER